MGIFSRGGKTPTPSPLDPPHVIIQGRPYHQQGIQLARYIKQLLKICYLCKSEVIYE